MAPAFTGTLRLSHRGSDTQFDLPLTIDGNGIGETNWTAPQGAPMGDYDVQVIVRHGEEERTIYTQQSFKVDEYKLPTMRASVTGPKEAAVRPEVAAARPVRRLSVGRRRVEPARRSARRLFRARAARPTGMRAIPSAGRPSPRG